MILLQDFRRKACVDWLAVRLCTARPTQFRYIQAALDAGGAGRRSVKPLDAGPGGVATEFRVRFVDRLANDYTALSELLDDVAAKFPLSCPPEIAKMEVACDFAFTGDASARESSTIAMTYRLQKSLLASGDKPRQFDPTIGRSGANRYMDVGGRRLDPRLNYREGSKWDDVSWQIYFKHTDRGQELSPLQWRARVEVTLQGCTLKEVGLVKLSDLDGYRFAKLARFFRFRTPIAPEAQAKGNRYKLIAINLNRRLNDATPERGLHSFESLGRRDKWRKLRRESSHLQADDELQRAVEYALRRLKL